MARHLRVVRTQAEDEAVALASVQQIARQVPSTMVRTYRWDGDEGEALFSVINDLVMDGITIDRIVCAIDIDGVGLAYLDWLGRQG